MKPFVRPPLVITTEPTKHNFYATFDPNTGKVTGMTPQKQGNCVEIDEYLANQIQKGNKTFFDFKVELQNNEYVLVQKDAVQVKDNNVNTMTVVENKFLYEIKYNDTDSCIRFTLSKNHKKFIVTIDDTLANNLSATIDMNKTNVYNFFTTDQDNTSIVDSILEVNLNDLIKNKQVEINYTPNFVPRLFCRKLYNYSYEVIDEF